MLVVVVVGVGCKLVHDVITKKLMIALMVADIFWGALAADVVIEAYHIIGVPHYRK